MSRLVDLTGRTFDRLTIIERVAHLRHGTFWRCRCICGQESIVDSPRLLSKATRSCGCLMKEARIARSTKHGSAQRGSVTPEYRIWCGIRSRCLNPNDTGYANYGRRGITVCAAWDDFTQFLADMGPRPSPQHTIERRDNDGPYTKENCAWIPKSVQAHNKRNNVLLTWQGETYCLTEWARRRKIPRATMSSRYHHGYTVPQILGFEPVPHH